MTRMILIYFQRLLRTRADKIQYYQWVLGNMCKENENSMLVLSSISKCNSETELKSLIYQIIAMDEDLCAEFGTDHAVVTYCEVSFKIL